MAQSWISSSPSAAATITQADAILSSQIGQSLASLLADADAATLSRTDIAQPAIFATSIACWTGLLQSNAVDENNLTATAGLSLGEYTALAIAGAMSFEDGLKLVTLRGKAMQDAAEASDGSMVALIGADEEAAGMVVDKCAQGDVLIAANFNAPGQVILSGHTTAINRAAEYAKDNLKMRTPRLNVAGAFHSPLMEPAAERLSKALEGIQIRVPKVPVMANVTGEPHVVGEIRNALVRQLTSSVRWADCIDYLRNDEELAGKGWIELAPGQTLAGIMRKIDRKLKVSCFDKAPIEAT